MSYRLFPVVGIGGYDMPDNKKESEEDRSACSGVQDACQRGFGKFRTECI